MATPHIYGPFCDRKGVTKTARKLCDSAQCDTFVTATANGKYQTWLADFPGDKPLAGYTVVELSHYVPPLPVEKPHAHYELIYLLERLDYEVNHNPAPVGDGGMDAEGIAGLVRDALDLGLLDVVRAAQ